MPKDYRYNGGILEVSEAGMRWYAVIRSDHPDVDCMFGYRAAVQDGDVVMCDLKYRLPIPGDFEAVRDSLPEWQPV